MGFFFFPPTLFGLLLYPSVYVTLYQLWTDTAEVSRTGATHLSLPELWNGLCAENGCLHVTERQDPLPPEHDVLTPA